MEKVIWDSADPLTPLRSTLDKVLYSLRAHDAADGLLYDAVSMADVLEASDGVLTFDALIIPFARIQQRMSVMQKVLDRTGNAVKVAAMQVSDPFKQRGTTNVAVIYELTDGQTITILFHNPDATPAKLTPADELISWKWMLNKKDITVAVAPEKGRDLEVRLVASRIMLLAEKNSARFAAANGKRAERMETIASLKTELETKQATLNDLTQQISAIEAERDAAGLTDPEPGLPTDEENAAIDRQIAALRERIDGMTNEQIYLVASILGISKPYAKGHDQLMERIFSNHPDDIADAIKRWEATNAAAATLNVDGLKAVVTSADPMPGVSRGSDWVVLNASRPLMGTETLSNGEFLDGRFYAAIDPRDSMAQAYFDEDVKNGASVVFVADHEALNAMALNTISADSVGAYLEMDAEERDIALRGFVLRLNGRTYGELVELAAKGMPALPEPQPDPEAEKRAQEEAEQAAAEQAAREAAEAAAAAEAEAAAQAERDAAAAAEAAAAEAAAQAQRDAEAAAAAEAAEKEAREAQESDDGDFLALAAVGDVDFFDKAVTDRLAALAAKYTDPDGAYLDMVNRAKTAAKNWFVAEFKKRVG